MAGRAYRLAVIATGNTVGAQAAIKELEVAAADASSGIGVHAGKIAKAFAFGLGASAAIATGLAIKSFAQFDDAMNQSTAIMGDLSGAMRDKLTKTAMEVSRTTTLSATQAAQSYYYLASAGMTAAQSVAALPQVAKFAQAGMFDMATATSLAVNAQNALGMASKNPVQNLKELTRVTDVLTRANTLADATTQQFSEALTNKAAAAFATVHKPIEEAVAVLAAFSNKGIKGAEAGTALSIVMRTLQTAAVKHADAFKKAGVAVFDAKGKMRDMADIVGNLEQRFQGLSDKQKKQLLIQLGFNDKTVQFMQILMGTSGEIRKYESELKKAGGTTDMVAKKQLQSFKSQMILLWHAVEDAAIGFGAKLAPKIEEAAHWFEHSSEKGGMLRQVFEAIGYAVGRVAQSIESAAGSFQHGGQSADILARAIRTTGDVVAAVAGPLTALTGAVLSHGREIAALVAGYVAFRGAMMATAAAEAVMGSASIALVADINGVRDAWLLLSMAMDATPIGILVGAIGLAAGALAYFAMGTDHSANSMQRADQQARRLKDSMDALASNALGLAQAQLNVKQSQADLTAAQRTASETLVKYGRHSEQYKQAQRAVQQATIDASRAELDLGAARHKSQADNAAAIQHTKDLTATLKANADLMLHAKDKQNALNQQLDNGTISTHEYFKKWDQLQKDIANAPAAYQKAYRALMTAKGGVDALKTSTGIANPTIAALQTMLANMSTQHARDQMALMGVATDQLGTKMGNLAAGSLAAFQYAQQAIQAGNPGGGGGGGSHPTRKPTNSTGSGPNVGRSGRVPRWWNGGGLNALGQYIGTVSASDAMRYASEQANPDALFLNTRINLNQNLLNQNVATKPQLPRMIRDAAAKVSKAAAALKALNNDYRKTTAAYYAAPSKGPARGRLQAKRRSLRQQIKNAKASLVAAQKEYTRLTGLRDTIAQDILDESSAILQDQDALAQLNGSPFSRLQDAFAQMDADTALGQAQGTVSNDQAAASQQSEIDQLTNLLPSLTGQDRINAEQMLTSLLQSKNGGSSGSGGGAGGGTDFAAIFRKYQRVGGDTGVDSTLQTGLSQAQAAALGGGSLGSGGGVVVVNQNFNGEPDQFVASRSASLAFRTAGLA